MKIFKYIDDSGEKIEEYNATLSEDGAKEVFKALKKHTLIENCHVVIQNNTEEDIEKAVDKLKAYNPLKITFEPESIKSEKFLYSRRAGLDKVGKYYTHYIMEVSIEKLPFLYHVLFDNMRGIEKRRTQLIYDYLMNKPSGCITKIMKKYGKEDVIFDPHMSEEDKISIIECFFENLENEYVGVEENSANNLSEIDDYAHAYERIMDKIEYNRVVKENKKRELK